MYLIKRAAKKWTYIKLEIAKYWGFKLAGTTPERLDVMHINYEEDG